MQVGWVPSRCWVEASEPLGGPNRVSSTSTTHPMAVWQPGVGDKLQARANEDEEGAREEEEERVDHEGGEVDAGFAKGNFRHVLVLDHVATERILVRILSGWRWGWSGSELV